METTNQIAYGANSRKLSQLVLAGFAASAAMVLVSYLLRMLGNVAPDFAAQYGAVLNNQVHPDSGTTLWWAGLIWHAINGTLIFSFLYDFLKHRTALPANRRFRGALYGFAIWLFVSAVIAPLAGEGFFYRLTENPMTFALTSLLCWLVYGVVLDEMTRVRMVHGITTAFNEKRVA